MSKGYDTGYYKLDGAELKPYASDRSFSIAQYIVSLSITESIDQSVIMGEVIIGDSTNLIDDFPLRGEEILTLTWTDAFDQQITIDFIVYAIDNISPNTQGNAVGYKLKIVTPEYLFSEAANIQQTYRGTLDKIAQVIFDQYLNREISTTKFANISRTIDCEPALGTQSLIIPSMSVFQSLAFLARRARSVNNRGSNFVSFQRRDKFVFKTTEQLIVDGRAKLLADPRARTYTYDPIVNHSVDNKQAAMFNVLSATFPKRQDTLSELVTGALIADTVEVDLLTKQILTTTHQYRKQIDQYVHTDKVTEQEHSDQFAEQFFSTPAVSRYVLIDTERPNQSYKQIIPNKVSSSYFINSIQGSIEIYGRNDLCAGDLINLKLPELHNTGEAKIEHQTLSGRWLIKSIEHNMQTDKQYMMNCTIVKDSLRKDFG